MGLTSATLGAGIALPGTVTRSVAAEEDLTGDDTFVFTFTMPSSAVNDLEVTHTFIAAPPPGTKTVSVGQQIGTLTAGANGSVTFPVTTANIADGDYPATVMNLPDGVTAGQVAISDNSGTLTLTGGASTTAGVTNDLTLTIGNATSNEFALTINDDPQTPDDGGGCNAAGAIAMFALPAVIPLLRKKLRIES